MDYNKAALEAHEKGKIQVNSKLPLRNREDLSIVYTPGVAEPCRKINEDRENAYRYTSKGNSVAVVTDGSAVLGLGDIGPEAAMPVMEGKAILFKKFAGIDAYPIAINSKDVDEIVRTVKLISPGFGGVNLEDISAPRCFEIEERLKEELDIPVFHDDQHGTAIVTVAALINALALAGKELEAVKIVICGAGAAGIATAKLLMKMGASHIVVNDSKGVIHAARKDLNKHKMLIAELTKAPRKDCALKDSLEGADVFIGVSIAGLLDSGDVRRMNDRPIIFAMANPDPEITPDEARKGGAFIVATGRSDYPNQINNVLAFPGIFKGVLESRSGSITEEMKVRAAKALAACVENPSPEMIIPDVFDSKVVEAVSGAVAGK